MTPVGEPPEIQPETEPETPAGKIGSKGRGGKGGRDERLAAALRANLARRKARGRTRANAAHDETDQEQ